MRKCLGKEGDHLLLHYKMVSGLWRVVLNCFCLTAGDVRYCQRCVAMKTKAMGGCSLALMWVVWRVKKKSI